MFIYILSQHYVDVNTFCWIYLLFQLFVDIIKFMWVNKMIMLKMLREKHNLSQKEVVALVISKSPQAYSLYEQGKREPYIATLMKLADYYKITVYL